MRLVDRRIPLCQLASTIENDLRQREGTGLEKPHIPAIADIVASAISTKSVNTCVWKHALPRQQCQEVSREKFIRRMLSNERIRPEQVMLPYGLEVLETLSAQGETVILMLDQTKIVDGHECLMLSIRVGERALPWLWKVVETEGGIGFSVQKEVLDLAARHLPEQVNVVLMGDRFYGTAALIQWCQEAGWGYRLRLRRNLHLEHEGGLLITGELLSQGLPFVEQVSMGDVVTHIGVVHDKGHPEAWIIAMDCTPTRERVLDYGLRWGIESMFSDLKSRGFDLESSHLRHPDRLSRLLLIVSIALYWCVSLGQEAEEHSPVQKKEVSVPGLPQGCAS
jgi:hypothetical protein